LWQRKLKDEKIKYKSIVLPRYRKKISPADRNEEFVQHGAGDVGMWFCFGCMDFDEIVEK